ncbi:hypothetical protein CCM_08567 [Cordyceps militaris CM01]|uniref:Uncharacterized protein n=1 Tax=Cordyceps militaris (strain CM01) TaxID=983644 RepID=G3JRS9_CORMM|nr:uncharacterized protein CCM_08567 [Cordyceps militaris CM01]EGX88522.1 hypothetical protein CCM_08567 [Cordyceps militaris CM01]
MHTEPADCRAATDIQTARGFYIWTALWSGRKRCTRLSRQRLLVLHYTKMIAGRQEGLAVARCAASENQKHGMILKGKKARDELQWGNTSAADDGIWASAKTTKIKDVSLYLAATDVMRPCLLVTWFIGPAASGEIMWGLIPQATPLWRFDERQNRTYRKTTVPLPFLAFAPVSGMGAVASTGRAHDAQCDQTETSTHGIMPVSDLDQQRRPQWIEESLVPICISVAGKENSLQVLLAPCVACVEDTRWSPNAMSPLSWQRLDKCEESEPPARDGPSECFVHSDPSQSFKVTREGACRRRPGVRFLHAPWIEIEKAHEPTLRSGPTGPKTWIGFDLPCPSKLAVFVSQNLCEFPDSSPKSPTMTQASVVVSCRVFYRAAAHRPAPLGHPSWLTLE